MKNICNYILNSFSGLNNGKNFDAYSQKLNTGQDEAMVIKLLHFKQNFT